MMDYLYCMYIFLNRRWAINVSPHDGLFIVPEAQKSIPFGNKKAVEIFPSYKILTSSIILAAHKIFNVGGKKNSKTCIDCFLSLTEWW